MYNLKIKEIKHRKLRSFHHSSIKSALPAHTTASHDTIPAPGGTVAAQAARSGCFCELQFKNLLKSKGTRKQNAPCQSMYTAKPGQSQVSKPYQGNNNELSKACSRTETQRPALPRLGKGLQQHSELLSQLNTPWAHTKGSPKRYQTSYKIHSDLRATSNCKWPGEGVGMGQDLDSPVPTVPTQAAPGGAQSPR